MALNSTENLNLDSNVTNQPRSYSYNHSLGGCMIQKPFSPLNISDMLPCRGNITPRVVERLETDLDFNEKVSMVFLLYNEVDIALQRLRAAESANRTGSLSPSGLLSDWAQAQGDKAPHWETTFLEALSIIQNFSIVEKLGYKRNDVQERFLPHNRDIALNVDLMRKALYVVCEKLTHAQGKQLIDLVKQDLEIGFPSLNSQEPDYLEMHILHWLVQKHITIKKRVVDVKNITKHLKVMEQFDLVDYLESVSKRYASYDDTYPEDPSPDSSEVASVIASNHSIVTNCSDAPQTTGRYHIDPKNIGFCVIINQKNFAKDTDPKLQGLLSPDDLADRIGTDIDRDRLIEAFGNFGFTINVWNNLTHIELKKSIELSTQELIQEYHSCFVLCILSHGKRNAVYGVNCVPVTIDEIEGLIQGKFCPKLLGKPKILIIQACQGHEKQDALPCTSDLATDGPTQSKSTRPEFSDMLTFWSTVPGYASFRDMVKGSWFIQTLCDELMKPTHEADMLDISLAVNGHLQNKTARLDGEVKSMQPQTIMTLGKRLVFPCNREARKTVVERMLVRHLFDAMLDEYLRLEYRSLMEKAKKHAQNECNVPSKSGC